MYIYMHVCTTQINSKVHRHTESECIPFYHYLNRYMRINNHVTPLHVRFPSTPVLINTHTKLNWPSALTRSTHSTMALQHPDFTRCTAPSQHALAKFANITVFYRVIRPYAQALSQTCSSRESMTLHTVFPRPSEVQHR